MSGRIPSFRVGASAVLVASVGVAGPAIAQDRLTVDGSVSAGVATNPFLEVGDTPSTASATVRVSPTYLLDRGLTRFELRGDATVTAYQKRYRSSESYSLSALGSQRISERSSLTASLGYINSIVGAFNDYGAIGIGVPVPGATPVLPPTTGSTGAIVPPVTPEGLGVITNPLIDPSLGGIGQRRQSYSASAGYTTGLGARDQLSLGLSVVGNRSDSLGLQEFNYVTQRVGYRRAIRAGLDVTADLSVGYVDYLRQRRGDATTYTPTVGGSYRFAEGASISLSVGVAIVNGSTDLPGGNRKSTNLSVQGSVCKADSRWNACISASRAALPSSVEGVRTQTAASASIGMRTGETGAFSVGATYSRSGAPLNGVLTDDVTTGGLFARRTKYAGVSGEYSQRIARRLSGFVTVGGTRAYGDGRFLRDANYEGRAGLRVRFGALR